MDWLALFVILAIVGQLCLPLIGRWSAKRSARQFAQACARLVEAAADQQAVTELSQTAKLRNRDKGVGDE